MKHILYIIKDKETDQYLEQHIDDTDQSVWYDWSRYLYPSCLFMFKEATQIRELYAPATGLIQEVEIKEFS